MSDRLQVVIIGAGGCGRDALDILEACNAERALYEILGFIVDPRYAAAGTVVNGQVVLGGFEWLETHASRVRAVCGIGASGTRRALVERAHALGVRFVTVVHPSVITTRWNRVGTGVVIGAASVLSNRIELADHVQVNMDCTIGHDARLRKYATLAPGVHVSGNVVVGEGAYVGTGASIIEKRSIGEWATVGAGAVVIRDVEPNSTVVGVPARALPTDRRPRE